MRTVRAVRGGLLPPRMLIARAEVRHLAPRQVALHYVLDSLNLTPNEGPHLIMIKTMHPFPPQGRDTNNEKSQGREREDQKRRHARRAPKGVAVTAVVAGQRRGGAACRKTKAISAPRCRGAAAALFIH